MSLPAVALPATFQQAFAASVDRVLKVDDSDFEGCSPSDPVNLIGRRPHPFCLRINPHLGLLLSFLLFADAINVDWRAIEASPSDSSRVTGSIAHEAVAVHPTLEMVYVTLHGHLLCASSEPESRGTILAQVTITAEGI